MLLLPFRVEIELRDKSGLDGPSIYYGADSTDLPQDTLHLGLVPATLEFFDGTAAFPEVGRYLKVADHRIPVLFDGSGDASFDAVASTFFFLSGWQEVHTKASDEHGRFPFEASIQFKLSMADLPVVDWYRHKIARRQRQMCIRDSPSGPAPTERAEDGAKTVVRKALDVLPNA